MIADSHSSRLPSLSTRVSATVRLLVQEDLGEVERIHEAAFPNSAITRLSGEAVHRYYDWQLNGPHDQHAIGAFVEGNLAGFCFGGTFRGALSGYLRENRFFLARRVLVRPWLLTDPLFRDRLTRGAQALKRFGWRKSTSEPNQAEAPRSSFGILAIAVDPSCQGAGVGQALMREAETETRRRGLNQMNLSVSTANVQAIRFYERGGWQRTPEGETWEGKMIKSLPTGS